MSEFEQGIAGIAKVTASSGISATRRDDRDLLEEMLGQLRGVERTLGSTFFGNAATLAKFEKAMVYSVFDVLEAFATLPPESQVRVFEEDLEYQDRDSYRDFEGNEEETPQ